MTRPEASTCRRALRRLGVVLACGLAWTTVSAGTSQVPLAVPLIAASPGLLVAPASGPSVGRPLLAPLARVAVSAAGARAVDRALGARGSRERSSSRGPTRLASRPSGAEAGEADNTGNPDNRDGRGSTWGMGAARRASGERGWTLSSAAPTGSGRDGATPVQAVPTEPAVVPAPARTLGTLGFAASRPAVTRALGGFLGRGLSSTDRSPGEPAFAAPSAVAPLAAAQQPAALPLAWTLDAPALDLLEDREPERASRHGNAAPTEAHETVTWSAEGRVAPFLSGRRQAEEAYASAFGRSIEGAAGVCLRPWDESVEWRLQIAQQFTNQIDVPAREPALSVELRLSF